MEEIEKENKSEESKKEENIDKKVITKTRVIIVVSSLILIVCIVYIINWFYQTKLNEKQIAELEKQILLENETREEEQSEELDEESKELIAGRNAIDFDKLYQINTDTKGWLKIDSLEISYPIMQYTDNDYYLGKNIYKEDSIAGSIFIDYRNNGFEDKNTIVYGHNMKNDSMFGKLDLIRKGECGTDVVIIVYTKEKSYRYKVFSSYDIDPKNFSRSMSIETMLEKSIIDFEKEVTSDSKVLTLYTCTNATKEKTIVHAYLEKEV